MRVTELETNEPIRNSGWTTLIAVLIIGLGIVAIAFPFFATVASTLVFGWIFILAGMAQMAYAFQSRSAGHLASKLILGLLYLFAGIFVVVNPLEGVLAFTLVVGTTIFVQGIIQVAIAVQVRQTSPNWGWMLVSGMTGILLGIFVGADFPFSATWLIGVLIGTNLLFDGVWMLTLHAAPPRSLDKPPSPSDKPLSSGA
jgi:uncharacterized membrane protein HdeD (DUF308 family)